MSQRVPITWGTEMIGSGAARFRLWAPAQKAVGLLAHGRGETQSMLPGEDGWFEIETDLIKPDHTDVFKTQVYTAGINYYIKNHNAKIQLNYNFVKNPEGDDNAGNRNFHDVNNDNFVINFKVAF